MIQSAAVLPRGFISSSVPQMKALNCAIMHAAFIETKGNCLVVKQQDKKAEKEAISVLTALSVPDRCHLSSRSKANAAFQSMVL